MFRDMIVKQKSLHAICFLIVKKSEDIYDLLCFYLYFMEKPVKIPHIMSPMPPKTVRKAERSKNIMK